MKIKKLLTIVAIGLAASALHLPSAHADGASDESRFVELMNADRAANGLAPLALFGPLVDSARNHSAQMASQSTIFHNQNLANEITGNWASIGENVGEGPSADDVHAAFMNSPAHRANVLGDYDRVGLGVVYNGATLFVTEVFWKTAASAAAAAAPPVQVNPSNCRKVRKRVVCSRVRTRRRRAFGGLEDFVEALFSSGSDESAA